MGSQEQADSLTVLPTWTLYLIPPSATLIKSFLFSLTADSDYWLRIEGVARLYKLPVQQHDQQKCLVCCASGRMYMYMNTFTYWADVTVQWAGTVVRFHWTMAVHFNELVACIALWVRSYMHFVGRTVISLFFSQLSAIAAASSSSYQVEFQFHDYHNPTGYKANGACCDWFFGCEPTCETIFDKICLGPGDLESWGQDCPWEGYVLEPGYVGDDSIMFGATIGSISNPFSFTTSEVWGMVKN